MRSTPVWRPMTPQDLPEVLAIANVVHPSFPEDLAVFAERLALYPAGVRVLEVERTAAGYLISHPWKLGEAPSLNSLLEELPVRADTFYLHDLAFLPEARGIGAARDIVEWATDHARKACLASLSLVAVNGSTPFWSHFGFRIVAGKEPSLRSYGKDARFMVRELP